MTAKQWIRSGAVLLHDGSTDTVTNDKLIAHPPAGSSLLRTRLDLQLSVDTTAVAGGIEELWWTEVLIVVGVQLILYSSLPTGSDRPLTEITGQEWIIWQMLYPQVNILDIATPGQVVTFSARSGIMESFAKRSNHTGLDNSLWLAWETIDATGTINSTMAGTTYALGGTIAVESLWETFP